MDDNSQGRGGESQGRGIRGYYGLGAGDGRGADSGHGREYRGSRGGRNGGMNLRCK